jgi:hypothetical protein
MTTQPNATESRHFFEQLYPDIQDGWLVLSQPDPAHVHPNGKRWLRSDWPNLAQTSLARVAEIAATLSAQDTVYFGVPCNARTVSQTSITAVPMPAPMLSLGCGLTST